MSELSIVIAQFMEELEESGSLWRSVDVRAVAVRFFGRWSNLITSCALDSREATGVPRISGSVQTPHVLAIQNVVPIEELQALFDAVLSGEVEVCGHVISYRTGEALNERQSTIADGEPYRWGNIGFLDRAYPYVQAEHPWSALTLSVQSDSIQTYLRHLPRELRGIDQEIRTCSHPYDGLSGLAKQFARGPDRFDGNHATRFDVIAPFQVRFARDLCHFKEELQIGITVGSSVAESLCRLGYSAAAIDGFPVAGTWDLANALPIQHVPDRIISIVRPAPSTGSITLFLAVGPHCVDKITLTRLPAHGPNLRVAAFRTVDPDLDYFLSGFKPGVRPVTNAFEQSVGRLFSFLGFIVDVLGPDKKLSDGIDFFAYTATMTFAVECTTGSIDAGGKLGKLVSRARGVTAAVDREVLAVLATSLEKERIADHEMSQAGEAGIVVLAREELDHLFEMCLANAPLASAAEYIAAQKAPKRPQTSLREILRPR